MAHGPHPRRRPVTVTGDPAVITAPELAAAAEFAAADAAAFAAEWAELSQRERALLFAGQDEFDKDGHFLAPHDDIDESDEGTSSGFEAQESGWLALAADGAAVVSTQELLAIAEAEPGSLGVPDQFGEPGDSITALRCIDRLIAFLTARRHTVIGHLCPPEDAAGFRAEAHLVEELQVATRVGPGVAHRDIETARLLFGPFIRSRHDLMAGLISDGHVRVLVFETRNVVDDTVPHPDLAGPKDAPLAPLLYREDKLSAIQGRVATAAHRQTPSQFRTTVRAAICAIDPRGEADRRAAGKATRDVCVSHDTDGMGVLLDRDDAASITAIHAELSRQAKLLQVERGGTSAARHGDADARIGACRADVLKTLILGNVPLGEPRPDHNLGADTTGEAPTVRSLEPPVRAYEGHLVIDLATLRAEAEHPCLLDGSPIPAPMGRDLARSVKAWRRIVTDPVTGHLLDYGRRVYLPEPLLRFIRARDGECTAPYCQRAATRCQMDHRVPFPEGPSDTANCGALCDRHHPLKTERYLSIADGASDGSMTWNTAWGQQVRTAPRPYLDNPCTLTQQAASSASSDDDTGPPCHPPGDDAPLPF